MTYTGGPVRVLIVAADPLTRSGLAALLSDRDEIEPAGRIASTSELPAALELYQPHALLWDFAWSAGNPLPSASFRCCN